MEGTPSSKRDQEVRETITDETCPKQGQTEEKHPPTSRHTQITPTTMMRSTALTITQPTPSLRFPLALRVKPVGQQEQYPKEDCLPYVVWLDQCQV